jgi:hypothetical protein
MNMNTKLLLKSGLHSSFEAITGINVTISTEVPMGYHFKGPLVWTRGHDSSSSSRLLFEDEKENLEDVCGSGSE